MLMPICSKVTAAQLIDWHEHEVPHIIDIAPWDSPFRRSARGEHRFTWLMSRGPVFLGGGQRPGDIKTQEACVDVRDGFCYELCTILVRVTA